MKKALFFSGGGTRVIGLFSVAEELLFKQQRKYDVIGGISAGAIVTLVAAVGIWNIARNLLLNLKVNHFFKVSPVTDKGGINIWAVVKFVFKYMAGKNPLSIGEYRLEKLLKKYVDLEAFERYQNDPEAPFCYVGCVNHDTGKKEVYNLKFLDYDKAIKAVVASTAIPIFTAPVEIKNEDWIFDGGLRDTIPTVKILQKHPEIDEVTNIYSKPIDNGAFNRVKKRNIIGLITRLFEINEQEKLATDKQRVDDYCKLRGKKVISYFCPDVLHSVYDTNSIRLKQLYMKAKTLIK